MNPENQGAADREAPSDAPAAASATAPPQAATDAAPALPADADAPDTVPDQLHELPPDLSPVEPSPAAASQAAPELPPIASVPKTPELSPAACGARLTELFPALFVAPGGPGPAKPIKLRIHADIQARAPGTFSKRTLGIFFSRYTTTNAYLKALSSAPHRFDLDGQPAGEIAEVHRQAATEELARRHALAAERRTAQRLPRRETTPAAEVEAPSGAEREAGRQRRPGPPPEARPDRRPDNRPAARPLQQQPGGGQRPERTNERGPDVPPSSHTARPARPPRRAEDPPHAARPQHPERARQMPRAEPPAVLPADPAQRERAMLLRAFESSPLSKANFCALKGMTEAALDAALAQAQAERSGR